MGHEIYVVDDDPDFRDATLELLQGSGFDTRGFAAGPDLLAVLEPEFEGIILSDLRMAGMSGMDLLTAVRKAAPSVPFVLITAHGDIKAAVGAIRGGAFDFLEKPAPPELLIATVRRALNARKLVLENQRLKARIARGTDIRARILGKSDPVKTLRREVEAVTGHRVDVLLVGETGTEKGQIARVIHDFSGSEGEFVMLDGGGLTETNFDETFLGNGAGRPGVLELAAKGTLFIDRISTMSKALQLRMVSLLTSPETAGGCRVVAAVPPEDLADLPTDLIFRLNLAEIEVPPLRERGEDFFLLLEHFLREAVARHKRPLPEISATEIRRLRNHAWPGNLRELRGVAERLVIGLRVSLREDNAQAAGPQSYDEAMREFETALLMSALRHSGGRKAEAADSLGIPRKRLYLRLKACGL